MLTIAKAGEYEKNMSLSALCGISLILWIMFEGKGKRLKRQLLRESHSHV